MSPEHEEVSQTGQGFTRERNEGVRACASADVGSQFRSQSDEWMPDVVLWDVGASETCGGCWVWMLLPRSVP